MSLLFKLLTYKLKYFFDKPTKGLDNPWLVFSIKNKINLSKIKKKNLKNIKIKSLKINWILSSKTKNLS